MGKPGAPKEWSLWQDRSGLFCAEYVLLKVCFGHGDMEELYAEHGHPWLWRIVYIYICNTEEIDICKNGHITSYNPQYPQILTPYHIPFDPMARYQEATKSGVGPDSLVQVAAQCNIIYIYISWILFTFLGNQTAYTSENANLWRLVISPY